MTFLARGCGIFGGVGIGKADGGGGDVVDAVAGMHAQETKETLREQRGAGDQDESARDFAHDEQFLEARVARGGTLPASGFQGCWQIYAGSAQGWQQSAGDAGGEREAESECESRRIDVNFFEPRQILGKHGENGGVAGPGHDNTGETAEHGKQHAFGDELPGEARG